MSWLRPNGSHSDTGRDSQRPKRATRFVEVLNFKTDGSLKKGRIENLSDDELIRKQRLTRTSVASSATGVTGNGIIALGCPVAHVGVAINIAQMGVACINRHRVRKEVKERASMNPDFAKALGEEERTLKKVRDVVIGVTVRGAMTVATMGVVGFDTWEQNIAELGHAAVGSATDIAADVTSTTAANAGQAASHGTAQVISHVATHTAAGGVIDPSNAADAVSNHVTIHQQFEIDHPHTAALDDSFHNVTQGISDTAGEFISSQTGLHFNVDSSLHEIQHVWHQVEGNANAEMLFLAQFAVDGGLAEVAQPLQQATEVGVDEARKRRWIRDAKYEKLEDM